jgi:hypothetical protein
MTKMAHAFAKAGKIPPFMALENAYRIAANKHPESIVKRLALFDQALKDANDAALERELCKAVRGQALHDFAAAMDQKLKDEGYRVTPEPTAPPPKPEEPKKADDAKPAEPKPQAPPAPGEAATTMQGAAVVTELHKRLLIDAYLVNGRPLGDCSVEEIDGAQASHARHARFLDLVTRNLPPGAVIRAYRSAEDVQALWEQSASE